MARPATKLASPFVAWRSRGGGGLNDVLVANTGVDSHGTPETKAIAGD